MHRVQTESLLWIRLQTITNHPTAFCVKRQESHLIINLYFTPALFEAIGPFCMIWSSLFEEDLTF